MTKHDQHRRWSRSVAAGAMVLQEFLLRVREDPYDAYQWLGIEPPAPGVALRDDLERLADAFAAKTKIVAETMEA